MSGIPLNYTTKKELYLIFRHGFLANIGQLWFSTCKSTFGICSILPATRVLSEDSSYKSLETLSLPESRFKEGKKIGTYTYYLFTFRLETFMFSPDHCNFACYLVFNFEDDHVLSDDGPIFETDYKLSGNVINITITLKKPNEESGSSKHNYMDWEKSWVEKRDDGWLEARLTKPLLKRHLENVKELRLGLFRIKGRSLIWIIVEGIEFRPVVADNNGWMISSG
ncbi:serine-threonine/tyrosine-protein kinase catalytic domain-containing protein, partial [Tanacetum coccineum]